MKLSLCIMCKNEEAKIRRCIASIKSVVDEIVVVDTGSQDRTVEIAREEGAIIYNIEWPNDFAMARNQSLEKVSGDWIVFLDADEYIEEKSLQYIRISVEECAQKQLDVILIDSINNNETGIINNLKLPKIFRKDERMMYNGCIHEKLIHLDRTLQALDCSKNIKVFHDGFTASEMKDKNKAERNGSLLLKELEKKPHDSDLHYYVAENYEVQDNLEKMMEHAQLALDHNTFTLTGVRQRSYAKILKACLKIEKGREFVQNCYEHAIAADDAFPDFDWYYGIYLENKGEYDNALKYFEKGLDKVEKYDGMAPSDTVMQIARLYMIIIDCYLRKGDTEKALVKLVKLVRVDKYDYIALYKLLCIINEAETAENIINFLWKIYDYRLSKDKLVLLNLSQKINNEELYNYYFSLLDEKEKEAAKNYE